MKCRGAPACAPMYARPLTHAHLRAPMHAYPLELDGKVAKREIFLIVRVGHSSGIFRESESHPFLIL